MFTPTKRDFSYYCDETSKDRRGITTKLEYEKGT